MQIRILVGTGPDSDDQERSEAAAQLRRLLLDLDVEDIRLERETGPSPEGAKSGEGIVLGALAVTLVPQVFTTVAAAIQAWSARASGRSVEFTCSDVTWKASGLTAEQHRQMLEDIQRRTASPTTPATPPAASEGETGAVGDS